MSSGQSRRSGKNSTTKASEHTASIATGSKDTRKSDNEDGRKGKVKDDATCKKIGGFNVFGLCKDKAEEETQVPPKQGDEIVEKSKADSIAESESRKKKKVDEIVERMKADSIAKSEDPKKKKVDEMVERSKAESNVGSEDTKKKKVDEIVERIKADSIVGSEDTKKSADDVGEVKDLKKRDRNKIEEDIVTEMSELKLEDVKVEDECDGENPPASCTASTFAYLKGLLSRPKEEPDSVTVDPLSTMSIDDDEPVVSEVMDDQEKRVPKMYTDCRELMNRNFELTITGKETLAELTAILRAENLKILNEIINEVTLPHIPATETVEQLPEVAMDAAKEISTLVWKAYCGKCCGTLLFLLPTYVAKRFFPDVEVGHPILRHMDDMVEECLKNVPNACCTGNSPTDLKEALKSVAEKAGVVAYDVAKEFAANRRPLSETVPLLEKLGLTDNEFILEIVKTATYITYKLLTSNFSPEENQLLAVSVMMKLADLQMRRQKE